jgi:hypothetical protein
MESNIKPQHIDIGHFFYQYYVFCNLIIGVTGFKISKISVQKALNHYMWYLKFNIFNYAQTMVLSPLISSFVSKVEGTFLLKILFEAKKKAIVCKRRLQFIA